MQAYAVTNPPEIIDALELELRQLGGVTLVSFTQRDGATVVELAAERPVDADALQLEAQRIAGGYLEGSVVVTVVGGPPPAGEGPVIPRVRLVRTVPLPGYVTAEVHLGLGERETTFVTSIDDRLAVAEAALAALAELGRPVPYVPVAAHGLSVELGAGCLVMLRDPATGELRRGLGSGASDAESTVKAVLNALNRYLSGPDGDEAD